jgi:heme oxygenase
MGVSPIPTIMTSSFSGAGDADVLAALRSATASRHELLDAGLALSGPAPTLADYHSHLLLIDGWLAPLQAWLDAQPGSPVIGAGMSPHQRIALVRADLAEDCLPRAGVVPAPFALHLPGGASEAYRWGVSYVIEGAQLGGKVLHERLAARLAPHPLRYLAGAAEGPGPRWRAFMLALRAQVRSAKEIDDACTGACVAFDGILRMARLG